MNTVLNNRTWTTWSNLAFLAPLLLALYLRDSLPIFLVAGTMISSFVYHFKKPDGVDWWWTKGKSAGQHISQWIDTGFALAVSLYMIDEIQDKPISFETVSIMIIGVLGIFMLFRPSNKYEEHHGIWHVIGAVAILLTLLL